MSDNFVLAQGALVYSISDLAKKDVVAFLSLIKSKKDAGWSHEMIQTYLVANIAHRIKTNYPTLKKDECALIAEEMIETMLERGIREKLIY